MTAANDDLKLLWFLLTSGDGHYLGTTVGERDVDFDYLRGRVAAHLVESASRICLFLAAVRRLIANMESKSTMNALRRHRSSRHRTA